MSNDPSPIRPDARTSGGEVGVAKAAYITVARQRYTKSTHDIEVDDFPSVGVVEDGAWVAAWLWVSQEDAGLCEEQTASFSES
jgi:hypothetical protein